MACGGLSTKCKKELMLRNKERESIAKCFACNLHLLRDQNQAYLALTNFSQLLNVLKIRLHEAEWNKLATLRGTATSDVTSAKTAMSQHANGKLGWAVDDSENQTHQHLLIVTPLKIHPHCGFLKTADRLIKAAVDAAAQLQVWVCVFR